ncbi:MAG: flagellar filament capping protein FliD [Cellvibrionaceae bacterium]
MSQNIVNLLGAGSGIDTQALVSELVAVERAAPQERIDNQRETAETQISDFGILSSALSSLQDAAKALGNSDSFNTKSASFTDSTAFSPVLLEPEAQVGDYSFTVGQLAQSQSLSTEAVFTNTTDEVGLGTLTFNFGVWNADPLIPPTPPADPTTFTEGTSKSPVTITIDNSNNSLQGLADSINDADFGVQASIINDGTGNRLVVRAESGLSNQLQITAADSDGNNIDENGLSRFAFNDSAFQLTQNQVGQDSEFTINGLAVSRSSNTVNDVIQGFEFALSGQTEVGEVITVSIEDDKSTAEQTVRDFVEIYNTFLETLEPLIGVNTETNEKGSLANDTLAKTLPSQIRQLLVGDVEGLSSTFTALTNIGVRTERDGTLSITESDFTDAINNNFDLFKQLFIPVTESSTDQISVNSFGDNTASGQYDVVITQPPTQGNLVGTDIAAGLLAGLAADVPTSASLTGAAPSAALTDFVAASGNFTGAAASIPLDLLTQGANANDYDFSITVDGVTSAADISLPVVDYADNDALATALQTAINDDANISGVTVTYATDRFVFTSSSTGAASSVSLSTVGTSADQLGITSGTATTGTGGANDYDFTLAVDGVTSGTISITPGTYTTFENLATQLQTQINADATLSGASASVTVAYNGNQFVITSDSTGVSSTIASATAVGSQAASLGITSGTATQGATTGGNTSAYDFSIVVDGTESGTISLDTGSYADLDAVAAEIEAKINADSALSAVSATVDVTYDAVGDTFTIESRRYGSSSSVAVTNIGVSAADLGLDTGVATAGINVAGTIDGVAGFGSGNVLLPALGEPGERLGLVIGENATSATVNFSRGLGGELEALIEQFLGNSGVLELRETSLNDDLEDLDEDQSSLDRRIEAYQERLTSQFIAMEAIVRSLQSSSSFLETTLDSLLNANNNN